MLGTRPDIAFVVIKMLQFSSNPTEEHLQKALYIVRYLSSFTAVFIFLWKVDFDFDVRLVARWGLRESFSDSELESVDTAFSALPRFTMSSPSPTRLSEKAHSFAVVLTVYGSKKSKNKTAKEEKSKALNPFQY